MHLSLRVASFMRNKNFLLKHFMPKTFGLKKLPEGLSEIILKGFLKVIIHIHHTNDIIFRLLGAMVVHNYGMPIAQCL